MTRSGLKGNTLLPLQSSSLGISLKLKGVLYKACVRSCMIYGSETWPLKVEQTAKLRNRPRASMISLICGVKLNERISSQVLRERLGIEAIKDVVRRNRLRWFGHVERKEDSSWVKKCMTVEVDGKDPEDDQG